MKKFLSAFLIGALLLSFPAYAKGPGHSVIERGRGSSSGGGFTEDEFGNLTSATAGEHIGGSNADNYIDFNDYDVAQDGAKRYTTIGGGLYIPSSRIVFVKENEDVDALIASEKVASGDVLILSVGNYSIGANLDVDKSDITIRGQGIDKTFITQTASAKNIIDVTKDNFTLSDLTVQTTQAGTNKVISVACTAAAVCTNTRISRVKYTTTGSGIQRGIQFSDAGGIIEDVVCVMSSTNDDSTCIRADINSTAEAGYTVQIDRPALTTTTAGGAGDDTYGIELVDSSSTQNMTVTINNPIIAETNSGAGTGNGISALGDSVLVTLNGGKISGSDNDIVQGTSATFTVNSTNLINNTPSGTITWAGNFLGKNIIGDSPAAQTIAGGNTITADACGGLKLISSAGAVTTSTSNTFTAPAVTNKGCVMHVCNSGANNITLDNNANFKSAGAADVVMTADDCVMVSSTGASGVWYQISALEAN